MANTLTLQNGSGNLTGGLAWLAQKNGTAAQNTAKAPASNVVSNEYNKGGVLGGLGYMGEKLAVGFVSSVEGIWDYAAGGIARLIGEFGSDKANKWAEEQIANDWFGDWYSHPEEWYNPSKGWQLAGDVAGGIGTSLPAMVTTAAAGALTVATGGTFAPLAGALISGSVAGLGAAGRATKEAYQQTGELGGKEFGYGALVGVTEGAIEGVSGAIGAGTGAAVKAISESFGRQTAKAVARQGVIKTMAKGFVGEAFEEAVAEILAPVYQRMTYDPNAKNASASEVAYAAFVGGLSGMVMGGGTTAVSKVSNLASGNRLATEGKTAEVMGLAGEISQFEADNNTGEESFRYVAETRQKLAESLEKTDGVVKTVQQKELLGDLNRANVAAVFDPLILRSAATAAANAETIAERLNAYGYTDANGKPITITAEMIREGYDPHNPKSLSKAIKTNNVLRTLAVLDATGRLSMDARAFEAASIEGFDMASEVDLNRYVEATSPEQRAAFAKQLGVEDIAMLDAAGFNNAVTAYAERGGKQSVRRSQAIAANADAVAESDAKPMPKTLNMKEDGTVRYRDADSDIAVTRKGDTYTIYDYTTKTASFDLTRAEVNRALRQYQGKRMAASKTNASAETTTTAEPAKTASTVTQDTAELDAYARENIKDYAGLSDPAKGMIRRVIRQARAKGIAEAEILSAARVSAHTGVNVVFNKNACRVVDSEGNVLRNEAGDVVYSDGFYDEQSNRIVINPEGTRTQESLLIHELDHAVRNRMRIKDWRSLERKALSGLTETERNNILVQYAPLAKGDPLLIPDENIAHFSEKILTTGKTIDLLLQERPSLGQRIIDFFKGAETTYANDTKLSGAAKRYLKLYKKHFEAFSAANKGANAMEGATGTKRYSFSSIAHTFFGDENMTAEDFEKGDYKQQRGYRDYVDKSVAVMLQSHKGMTEKAARAEIESSIDGIVRVALAAKRAGYDILDAGKKRNAADSKKRLLFSSLEPNSDYFTSHDVSTICDKRKNFAQIYDDIVRREEELNVPKGKRFFDNVDNYFYIHKVLAEKGLTQPCRECYVESMRKNLAPMANAFLRLVQETDAKNTANDQLFHQEGKDKGKAKKNNTALRKYILNAMAEYGMSPSELNVELLSTEEGLAELKVSKPKIYEGFNSFYGQSKPKLPREATPFRFGELTALLTKDDNTINQTLVKRINQTGGFRLQSYSDFQVQNYVDVLQVLFEAGTLGLSGHAYTKVPAFLDATANTNLKRNISIFMYKDGTSWVIDKNDSFPGTLEDITALVEADESGNTGIIAVSQNEQMSAYIMADDRIGYGIPFHKSGLKMDTVRATEVKTDDGRTVLGYQETKDHTRQQSEVYKKSEKKVKKPIDIYSFWDFGNKDNLTREELIQKNLTEYLNRCEKNGYYPKFREYLIGNDTVLDDVLRYSKELNDVSPTATVSDISFEYKDKSGKVVYRVPYGYYKFLGDFSMFAPDGTAVAVEPLSLANYDFKAAEDFFSDAEQVRRNELLQQFANGTERQYYRESGMTAEQLQKVIDSKRSEVVEEIVTKGRRNALPKIDADYMRAVDRADVAALDKIIEIAAHEEGYDSPKLYHGSDRFGFTKADNGKYLVLTNKEKVASAYTKNGRVREIRNKTISAASIDARLEMNEAVKAMFNSAQKIATSTGIKNDEIRAMIQGYADAVNDGKMSIEEAVVRFESYAEKRLQKLYTYGKKHLGSASKYKTSYTDFLNKDINAKQYRDSLQTAVDWMKTYANERGVIQGVYQMYAKTDGMLEVEGHGRKWNDIGYEHNGITYSTTKQIADSAKAKGYSGVIFRDIVEAGKYANNTTTSDVYVLFDGKMAKSADAITFNDKGKIIPPSQRFNDRKNEFRYALPKQERIEQNLAAARASIVSDLDAREYKAPRREKLFNAVTSAQIAFTNAQAGIEKMGKMLGVSTVDVDVESVRSARKAAEAMIGGQQYRIGKVNADGSVDYQGEGIARIYKSVRDKGGDEAVADFDTLLFAQHHVDRMTLKERTEKRIEDLDKDIKKVTTEIEKNEAQIKKLGRKKAELAEKRELREKVKKLKKQLATMNKQAKQLTARGTMENKPVLGVYMDENGEPIITTVDSAEVRAFTVEEAREMIDALKSKYDYFEEKAEAVWAYNRNLNQYRVDTGLITQESFDEMQWLYPHYVPTYRVDSNSGIASIEGKYNLAIKKTVKGAKGSTKRLISPEVIIARQTMETIPAGRENQLTRKLAEAAERRGKNNFIEVVSTKKLTAEELAELDPTTIRPKGGQITYFKDGEMQTLRVAKEIFAGYESFTSSGNSNAVYDAVTYLNSLFKRLVTSASPAFIVRNSLRDIQEAGINTHYTKTFIKNYGVAIEQYRTGGKWLREFMAFGGLNSSLFDFNKGTEGILTNRGFEVKDENILKKALHKFENANQMVEMLPRLAEYISAREAGMSPQKAILDAADVTTNFGRSGRVTRVLNRTIVPFLNPSIQGFSKMVRNVTDAFGAGSVSDVSRALGSLGLKAALVGIIPMMFNRALYEDDEDYQNLRDTDKENNYLFKIGDTFIKLPRGRVASALAGLYNRTVNVAQGKKFDVLGYIENLSTQVTPVDSASRNIFSPILRDLPTNTTWYGTAIEGREFENLAPEDRYDEGTSSIAIAIGKVINYSPKKIHYLLDQYSGVIGDFILPMTTEKAERGYVASAFTLDPATSNKLSESFYKVLDEYTYAKNKGDAEAALVLKYLQKTKSAASELFDEKTAVQKGELKGAEKLAATRTIQLEINALYLQALEDLPSFRDALKGTEDIANDPTYATMIAAGANEEKVTALRFAEATRLVYGEAQALQWYDKGVYEEAELMNLAGLSYYNYYEAYFQTRGLESTKDKEGNTVAGSKRAKVSAVVNAMTISPQQKLLLMASFGYKPKDGEITGVSTNAEKKLITYITKLPGITAEQRVKILTACGFKVTNGRVVLNG